MTGAKILAVEDEGLVARDIQEMLKSIGYDAPAVAYSGEEAVRKVEELHPDLVLMDIVLNGDMDGIEAAEILRARFNIPVVYLTAYADEETLQRAKISEPFGYILKPFEERILHTTIEMALYKHRLENALRESEEKFRTFLENLGDVAYRTDASGNVAYANKAAEKIAGLPLEDIVGEPFLHLFTKESRKAAVDAYQSSLEGGSPEYELTFKNGRLGHFKNEPLKDKDGKVIGVFGVARDITGQKHLEKQLRHAQKMAAVGTLAGGIAHNFNNILAGIMGYISLVRQGLDKESPQIADLDVIERLSWRGAKLTKALLAFSCRGGYHPRLLNINTLLENVLQVVSQLAGRGIKIKTELSGGVADIY